MATDEVDDTILRSRRPAAHVADETADADTILRDRRTAHPVEPLPVEVVPPLDPFPVEPVPPVQSAAVIDSTVLPESTVLTWPPVLIEPPTRAQSQGIVRPDDTSHTPQRFAVYRVVINSGEPIALDVPIIVGRQPVPSRIPTSHPARLVHVPSPAREVSSSHLELRQHGSSIVVTDLRSTNGTIVTMPGSVPLTLRQGESVVVSVGAVVNIGDGNIVEILPIQRAVPVDTGPFATGERLP
jgi:hypothetical protein